MIHTEDIFNSHPLYPLSSDNDELEVLISGHFLIRRSLNAIAESYLSNIENNRLCLRQKTTKIVQITWKRWENSILSTVQQKNY